MEAKFSIEDLRAMQRLPLSAKVRMTQQRIKWFYDHCDGQVYVSFSGGKDSTVLLHLVRQMYNDVGAVFVDTGLEYPEVRDLAIHTDNVTIIKPKKTFRQVITDYGYPVASKGIAEKIYYAKKGSKWAQKFIDGEKQSRYAVSKRWECLFNAPFNVSAYCCHVMKKNPVRQYENKAKQHPFLGTLACESALRTEAWLRSGCNAYESKRPLSMPLAFWTEQDILRYIYENGIQIASVYGEVSCDNGTYKNSGVVRTGCMFCMFGCHLEKHPNRFERMKQTHPKIYSYCMKPLEDGGLGLDDVLTYCEIDH